MGSLFFIFCECEVMQQLEVVLQIWVLIQLFYYEIIYGLCFFFVYIVVLFGEWDIYISIGFIFIKLLVNQGIDIRRYIVIGFCKEYRLAYLLCLETCIVV